MGELGDLLRKTREDKGLSLKQAEEATRIRQEFLQALEDEEFERLPAPVYVKGFLRNYAVFLGLDAQQLVSLYQEPEATPIATTAPAVLNEPLEPMRLRRLWPLAALAVAAALLVAAWWGYQRYFGASGPLRFGQPVATPTAVPTATSVPPSPTPAAPTPTLTLTRQPTATLRPTPVGLELSIEVVGQRSWVLVLADGERAFAGILEPGAKDSWTARERIALRSGNAGAVRVTLNGRDLGLFGESGQVAEQEWTAPGVPTRTPTPTSAP